MPTRFVVAVLVLLCASPTLAAKAKASAVACRRECASEVQACVDGGGRPRKCTRSIRRQCRKVGLTVCVPPEFPETAYAVSDAGIDVDGCGTPSAPCATIQFVLDTLVEPGGATIIKVAAGRYDASTSCNAGTGADRAVVCIVDKHVSLLGGFVPPDWETSTSDPAATVIDANGEGRGLVVLRSSPTMPSPTLRMDGFTIRNGAAHGKASGQLIETWAFGAGMLVGDSNVELRRIVFHDNTATGGSPEDPAGGRGSGGGLALSGNQGAIKPSATLVDVTFEGNHARGGDGHRAGGYALGGGMFAFGYTVSGDGLVFTDNTATAGDGDNDGVAGVDKADALGGAITASIDSVFDLRNVQASGNVAMGGAAPNGAGGGGYGGVIFTELATVTLSDSMFVGNRAQGGDGRNSAGADSIGLGGAIASSQASLTLDRMMVIGNEARSGSGVDNGGVAEGGGVAVTAAAHDGIEFPFTIRNTVIANNLATVTSDRLSGGGGGGLWIQGATGTVEHTTIADNRLGKTHLLGGGVAMFPLTGLETRVAFINTIFANHTSPATDPDVDTNAALWVGHLATADVTAALFANNVHDTNADSEGGLAPGVFNFSNVLTALDAGFVSSGDPDDDYHLTASSAAVDAAMPSSVSIDLDGNARPAGAAADVGAYEITP